MVLESGHERYLLLKNLMSLREKPQYERISIKEDYTPFERSIIRDDFGQIRTKLERTKRLNSCVASARESLEKPLFEKISKTPKIIKM